MGPSVFVEGAVHEALRLLGLDCSALERLGVQHRTRTGPTKRSSSKHESRVERSMVSAAEESWPQEFC